MKMPKYLSAVVGAAMVTFGTSQIAQAIVAVDDAALSRQQVLPGQFSGVVSLEGSFSLTSQLNRFVQGLS